MGLIFALAKNIKEHINQNKKQIFKPLPSKMIRGSRIGIGGFGCSANQKIHNLIGRAELDIMKNTACFINICRGAVVDEDTLYYAFKEKSIRGACIDILKMNSL